MRRVHVYVPWVASIPAVPVRACVVKHVSHALLTHTHNQAHVS